METASWPGLTFEFCDVISSICGRSVLVVFLGVVFFVTLFHCSSHVPSFRGIRTDLPVFRCLVFGQCSGVWPVFRCLASVPPVFRIPWFRVPVFLV